MKIIIDKVPVDGRFKIIGDTTVWIKTPDEQNGLVEIKAQGGVVRTWISVNTEVEPLSNAKKI